MPFAVVDVDDRAFQESFKVAMDAYRLRGEEYAVEKADQVVEIAKSLVAVGTDRRDPPGRLKASIRHDPPLRNAGGVSVKVSAGGPGIRETLPQEFGTYKMRAQPYMRPALAAAAGGFGAISVAVRTGARHVVARVSRSRNRG